MHGEGVKGRQTKERVLMPKGKAPRMPEKAPNQPVASVSTPEQGNTQLPNKTLPNPPVAQPEEPGSGRQLDQMDYAVLREWTRNPSITDTEVCRGLGIARSTLIARKKNPRLQRAIEDLVMPDKDLMRRVSRRFILRLERVANTGDDDTAVRGAAVALKHHLPARLEVDGGEGIKRLLKELRDEAAGEEPQKERK